MRPCVQSFHLYQVALIRTSKYIPGRPVGTNATKDVRYGFGVSEGSKQTLDARSPNRREKVLKIHSQNHRLPYVGLSKRPDRTSFHKPMNRFVSRNPIDDIFEDLALQSLHSLLGRLNQSQPT